MHLARRAILLDLYAVDRSPAVDVIRATPGPLRGYATYDIPTVPTWHNASMVVIGDAAHASSPSSGQGASMAIGLVFAVSAGLVAVFGSLTMLVYRRHA